MANRGKTEVYFIYLFIYLFIFAPKSLQIVTEAMKLKYAYLLEGKLWPT